MKKFFYLMSLCLCMFAGVAVMTSCGDDDDELDPSDVNVKTGITEKGNTMTLAAKTAAYQYTLEATFDSNDLCTKMIETETYSSSSAANAAWEAYKANYASMPSEWAKYKKDGRSIICDYTDDWKGKSKAEVRQYFEWMKEELDHYSQK